MHVALDLDAGNLNFNFIRRSGDVIVAPFDNHDVLASLAHQVTHIVVVATCMLHEDFLAWSFGSVNTHVENVVTCINSISRDFE